MEFHAVERNLRQSFRTLASFRESGEVRETGGLTIVSLGAQFQMFNAAFLSRPVDSEADLEKMIAIAAVHMRARGLRWSFWVCDGWLSSSVRRRANKVFGSARLALSSELPGMLAEAIPAPRRELPAVDVQPVATAETLRDFCAIGSLCFRVPPPWFDEIFDRDTPLRSGFRCYVAYSGMEAVATAATVATADAVGIYNVATRPECRGRGFAETIVREALRRAREQTGLARTILQSTSQGLPLYERLGYRAVTSVRVYVS